MYVPEDPQEKPFVVLSFSRQTLSTLLEQKGLTLSDRAIYNLNAWS